VTNTTKKIVDGFVPNFTERFPGERKTKFVFRYSRPLSAWAFLQDFTP